MIIGFLIPLVSVGFIAVLVGAIFSFGLASGFSGYEYELFLAITSLAILVSYADKKYLTLKTLFLINQSNKELVKPGVIAKKALKQ
ncbi:DoxX [Enterococcus faecalis]|nr:DoxX [Enterococcus faecalis]